MKNGVMIIGLGSVGGYALEFLARSNCVKKIYAASRNREQAIEKINLTKIGAAIMGYYPDIEYVQLDLQNIDETAKTLSEVKPEIVINTARLIKGIKYGSISYPLGLGYGIWTSLSLSLVSKMMKAIRSAGINPFIINTGHPDVEGPVLAKLGLAPTIGAGNLQHLIPRIQFAVSQKVGVSPNNVLVFLVASHFLDVYASKRGTDYGSPSFIKIIVDGSDITQDLGKDWIYQVCAIPVPSGEQRNHMVASSCVNTVLSYINQEGSIFHAPSPNGLPGGYPVRIKGDKVEVVLPKEISLEKAIEINLESLKYDGIEAILPDGTMVFDNRTLTILREHFSFDCPSQVEPWKWDQFGKLLIDRVISKK